MKSRANIGGHPMHPILVALPIGFFVGAFVFDLLANVLSNIALAQTGFYMTIAGIIGGLMAAVPGFIDYLSTVPPNSSAKTRGMKHGLINSGVLIIFAITLFLRTSDEIAGWLVVGLELVGVIMLGISGWMGGTLVYRNLIGVDMRYAHAGKWKEEFLGEVSGSVQVATKDELKPNQMKLVHVNNKRIVIAKTEEAYVAFDDSCPHRGGSLAGGSMMCGTVQCPWHGSQFDVTNGKVQAGPAKKGIPTYSLTEEGNKILLNL